MSEGERPQGTGPVLVKVRYGVETAHGPCYAGADRPPSHFHGCKTAMKARVTVTLKNGVLDPQGKAIEGALKSLGFAGVATCARARCSTSSSKSADEPRPEPTLREAARSCSPTP